MSDPVAVYAAVVATGSLGWQVYRFRSDRRGRLVPTLRADMDKYGGHVLGTIYNSNDYAVKLLWVTVRKREALPAGNRVGEPGGLRA